MRIDIRNLNFEFNKKEILKDISFSVESGEFLGVLGANGCGKSTLLKNILGLLKPKSGDIFIDDKPISSYTQKALSRIIGFVPQKSLLNTPFLVKEIILMGRFCHLKSAFSGYDKQDFKKLDEVMQLLGISEFKDRVAISLSGGEFAKVLIARALVSEPKILLLDEPTSALDLHYAVEMMKICKSLTDELELITLAVVHDLNLASMFCSRNIMLKNGRLAKDGVTNELYTSETLKEIYNLDCEIIEYQNQKIVVTLKEQN